MKKHNRKTLPENFATLEEAAEFWENHDLTEYWNMTKPVRARIAIRKPPRYVLIEESVAQALTRIAKKKKVPPELLANLWLKERVAKAG